MTSHDGPTVDREPGIGHAPAPRRPEKESPMETIRLTVNGEPCRAAVAGRTQLAELLRDHLHLTGTHLGCEHGVCGACTVLMDGRPVRSCIAYARACEGADVVTVEGLKDDPTGRALREAFSRHHALQCGFCTSGMLITAWDIVTRLAPVDEATVRRELGGNLCRCTGYMGIVAAVREVALQRRGGGPGGAVTAAEAVSAGDGAVTAGSVAARGGGSSPPPSAGETVRPAAGRDGPGAPAVAPAISSLVAFEPFEVDPAYLAGADTTASGSAGTGAGSARAGPTGIGSGSAKAGPTGTGSGPTGTGFGSTGTGFGSTGTEAGSIETEAGSTGTGAARSMTRGDGWTLIERAFVTGYPVDALWALFEDLPRVAECLPGVRVESADAGRFAGRAEIRFGPIGAVFQGGGTRETDAGRRTGVISGSGSDARGHSTLEAELRYVMSGEGPSDSEPRTRIGLGIRFRIQGGLAQFNRGDLVESFADVMLTEFMRNCERRLAGGEMRGAATASGFALLWRMIKVKLGF